MSGEAERIARALDQKAHRSGREWLARCPCHEDRNPSFSIRDEGDTVVYHCLSNGCSQGALTAELKRRGLLGRPEGSTYKAKPKPEADFSALEWQPILPVPADAPPPPASNWLGIPTFVWTYTSDQGEVLAYVCRFDPPDGKKQILPLVYGTLKGATGWHWKHIKAQRPLYGLDRLAARPDAPALVVEGEKAADAAAALLPGYVVTTWQAGTNAVDQTWWPSLAGRKVTIWPDADEAGHKAAKAVADALRGIAASVRTVELPEGLPDKWDLADPIPEGIDVEAMLGEAKEPEPPLRIIRPSDWQGKPVPERRWHVRDWIPDGHVTAFYGNGGTGKSLLAQQLLTASAIGADWLGLETKRCRMIGFFCEDHEDELHRRQEAINSMYGCSYSDLDNMQLVSRVHLENLLMDFTKDGTGTATELHKHLIRWARDFGAEGVIVDTAADTFGGNENARTEVRLFIQKCLGEIAREINGSVILCAHPSVAGMRTGTGGSTGWSNSVRSRLHLHIPEPEKGAEPDYDLRVIEVPKANYAKLGTSMVLRWQHGVLVPDAKINGTTSGPLGAVERDRCQRVFLKLLAEFAEAGIHVSNSPQGRYAPREMAASPNREGFRVSDFERAMRLLIAQKRIKLAKKGRGMAFVPCDPAPDGEPNPMDFNSEAA